ncbi:DUF4920 domain-containing protein [Fulvivirga sp. RKSG066]|uniref:DUF4920 domain-containing protein n=1 Tax=Fulvivirga aurantia TaxID=2529383 RepID=UPI0012BCC691|nr:DUF4920 domain-containing protein [Fulvivirga aurantia]MTI21017.1 DUF4920 domain-containing protein [Fulvivirga aurantia]
MKKAVFTLLTGIMLIACAKENKVDYYGAQITTENALKSDQFIAEMSDKDSLQVKVEATIIETCEKKGCWMTLDMGYGKEMRVTFKDYGFFVPTDSVEGHKVIIDGLARRTTTDVETLRHFAEDGGKSEDEIAQITEPKEEITFVATGAAILSPQE